MIFSAHGIQSSKAFRSHSGDFIPENVPAKYITWVKHGISFQTIRLNEIEKSCLFLTKSLRSQIPHISGKISCFLKNTDGTQCAANHLMYLIRPFDKTARQQTPKRVAEQSNRTSTTDHSVTNTGNE
jgi:hypothetical protein